MAFGEQLREARERKGYSLTQAARRLRIRPDILQAIESGDFDNMPPRGYTRSMVNAYAKLVGLNPTEMTNLYLDEAYRYQDALADASRTREFDMGAASRRSSRSSRSSSSSGRERSDRNASTDRYSRSGYNANRPSSSTRTRSAGSDYRGATRSGYRGSTSGGEYTNFYAASYSSPKTGLSKRWFFVAGAIIVALLIIVLVVAFGCSSKNDEEDTSTVPITGIAESGSTDTSEETETDASDTAEEETVEETAPTSSTFAYEVLDGESAYIEVYLDDDGASVAATVEGPSEESFEFTGTLKFVTTNPDGVVATLDGEEVTPEDLYGKGVYTYTVDFADVLAAWEEEHGVVTESVDSDDSEDTTEDEESESDDEESTE